MKNTKETILSYSKAYAARFSDCTNLIGERLYTTPDGNKYPSVTTILSKMTDKTWLDDWRKKVGSSEADRITKESTELGSNMHKLLEHHLNGDFHLISTNDIAIELYRNLLIYMKKVEAISLELPLYSDVLKIAGRTDCIGYYQGVLSIIDFKSARREKKAEDIESYFLQCCFYAMMLYEVTGISCTQLVVLISVRGGLPQVFKRKIDDKRIEKCVKMSKEYHINYPSSS